MFVCVSVFHEFKRDDVDTDLIVNNTDLIPIDNKETSIIQLEINNFGK